MRLVWVRSDAATLSRRLAARGSGRDTAKLADFAGFTASMRLGAEPAVPHATIDNRQSAPEPLAAQVAALLRAPGTAAARRGRMQVQQGRRGAGCADLPGGDQGWYLAQRYPVQALGLPAPAIRSGPIRAGHGPGGAGRAGYDRPIAALNAEEP